MIKNLTLKQFEHEFNKSRQTAKFSKTGFELLFDFLTDYFSEHELSAKIICQSFSEYKNLKQAAKDYGMDEVDLIDNTLVLICPYTEKVVVKNF